MDQSQQYIQDLEKLFHASKDVMITTRANPRIDGICALLALGRAFESMPLTSLTGPGQQRKVIKAVSGRQGTQYSVLPSSDTIVSELGLRDFVIGLPGYIDKSVESVSWYVDQGRLHVVLKSNAAVPMQFDPKTFDPFYAGANFDVVCVVDADTPADLGNLYRQDPGMFTELPVVNISNSMANTRFGRVNVVDTSVSSTSELVYEMLTALRVHIDTDTAALLLCGIEDGTEFLSQRATPRTLEIVDQLKMIAAPALDTRSVRSQVSMQPLPVHPQGVLPPVNPVGQMPGVSPYGVPGQGGMMPGVMPPYGMPQNVVYPQGYAMPPQAYPPMPYQTQGYPPQNPVGYPSAPPAVPNAPHANSAFSQFHAPATGNQQPPSPNGGYQPYNSPQYGQPNQPQTQPQQTPWDILNTPPGGNFGKGGGEGGGRS